VRDDRGLAHLDWVVRKNLVGDNCSTPGGDVLYVVGYTADSCPGTDRVPDLARERRIMAGWTRTRPAVFAALYRDQVAGGPGWEATLERRRSQGRPWLLVIAYEELLNHLCLRRCLIWSIG